MVSLIAALVVGQVPGQSQVSLVSSMATVTAGSSFDVALRLKLKPGWHVYWKNPGESGFPPALDWRLPPGWTASDIEWPTPKRVVEHGIANYIYEGDVLLPVRITCRNWVEERRPYELVANAKWLVCKEQCLAGKAKLSVMVFVGQLAKKKPQWSDQIQEVRAHMPAPAPSGLSAWVTGRHIALRVPKAAAGTLFYPADELIDPDAGQPIQNSSGARELMLTISSYAPNKIERLKGLLIAPTGAQWAPGIKAINVDIPIQRRTS